MPRSEIDDIFAAKSASLAVSSQAFSKAKGKVIASDERIAILKKQKNKERPEDHSTDDPAGSTSKRKRPETETETVLGASCSLPVPAKAPRTVVKDGRPGRTKKSKIDDEHKFRDSRGTGPRRKTDDGYLIYKEDELNLANEGGDTPLCPFDCDCCF